MKRFLVILVLVFLVVSSAAAEDIDLSGLSFDQLIQLQSRINMELMQRDEWQEVTVPIGVYLVGKDIPAGKWSVSTTNMMTFLTYGKELEENKSEVKHSGDYIYQHIPMDQQETLFDFVDGYYVHVNRSVVFKPASDGSLFKFN